FYPAARLLRRLAEAENEDLGNNAAGVWSSLFLTFLGATEIPGLERLVLVEEALDATPVVGRQLGLRALRSALEDREIGMPIADSHDVPRAHWRPKTRGEVWAIKRRALALLDRAIRDPARDIRRQARQVFLDYARSLARQGMGVIEEHLSGL